MTTSSIHQKSVPELRFPGFSGEWHKSQLKNVLYEHKTRNNNSEYDEVFSVAKNKGVINQIEHLGRSYASEDISNYKVIYPGDIIYTKSPTAGFPFGIIKQNHTGRTGVVSVLYAVFRPKDELVGNLLHLYFLSPQKTYNYLYPIVNKGAKNTINISNKDFLNGANLAIPEDKLEQKKIVSFINDVDDWVSTIILQRNNLEEYKRTMMQKIFSQELRFKDKNGNEFPEWEEKQLNKIFEEVIDKVGNQKLPTYSISAGKGWVSQEEKFGRDISGKQNEKYTVLQVNDFSYNKGNSKTYQYGCIYPNNTGEVIAVPNVFISFRASTNEVSTDFYSKLFENHFLDRGLRQLISSGARMDGLLNVNKHDFFKLKVPVPHIDEQQRIASFFLSVDRLISLKSQQIEKAEMWKRGLLQKMFV